MHQPALRKDTKSDRLPPAIVINRSEYSTDGGAAAYAAALQASAWLERITKEKHG